MIHLKGKVQEEELDSCRANRRAGAGSGMRVQGETKEGSPCRDSSRLIEPERPQVRGLSVSWL
jgi:hypothetical protein